jgi:hypothetical protein
VREENARAIGRLIIESIVVLAAFVAGLAMQKYRPLDKVLPERVIHRSYHEYTVPPNTGSITVEIKSEGAGGGPEQRCTVIRGEKGVNGGGDGGNGVFCGDAVAILPGHGGNGSPETHPEGGQKAE